MAEKRKAFVLYTDHLAILRRLTDEQAGRLFKMIAAYQNGEEIDKSDFAMEMAFEHFRIDFERDAEKYKEVCRKRAEAGKRHRGNQYSNPNKTEQMEQMSQVGTNGTDKENEKENEKDKDKDIIKDDDNNIGSGGAFDSYFVFQRWNTFSVKLGLQKPIYHPDLKKEICQTLRYIYESTKGMDGKKAYPDAKKIVDDILTHYERSEFLKSRKFGIDWVFKKENAIKILQGNYDSATEQGKNPTAEPQKQVKQGEFSVW